MMIKVPGINTAGGSSQRATWLLTFALGVVASAPVGAQQIVPAPTQPAVPDSRPVTVEVRGIAEVLGSLQRVERKLDRLLASRWEYTFVQRNRFEDQGQTIRSHGEQGWELVSVTVEEGFIFKRRAATLR